MRQHPGWVRFLHAHPQWVVEFNEASGMPRRAFGPPVPTAGGHAEERARAFLAPVLQDFGLPLQELELQVVTSSTKFTYVHFNQRHAGLEVLFADALVKLDAQGRVVSFGVDMHRGLGDPLPPSMSDAALLSAAGQGLADVLSSELSVRCVSCRYRTATVCACIRCARSA